MQMTLLDPVDYNMGEDPGNGYDIALGQDSRLQLPRINIPQNVVWTDAYYRQTSESSVFPQALGWANFMGEAIGNYPRWYPYNYAPGTQAVPLIRGANINVDLTGTGADHSEVHEWYLGTITTNDVQSVNEKS